MTSRWRSWLLVFSSAFMLCFVTLPVLAGNPPLAEEIVGTWVGEVKFSKEAFLDDVTTYPLTMVINANGTLKVIGLEGAITAAASSYVNYVTTEARNAFSDKGTKREIPAKAQVKPDLTPAPEIAFRYSNGVLNVDKQIIVGNIEKSAKPDSLLGNISQIGADYVAEVKGDFYTWRVSKAATSSPESIVPSPLPSSVSASKPTLTNWLETAPPGLGRIGLIPGPKSTLEAIVGILAPGLIAVLGGLLGGLFGNPLPNSAPVPSLPGGGGDDDKPPVPPPVPPEPPRDPEDIEWTASDGRKNVLVWNPEYKGYINILTGGLVAPEDIDKWKQNIEQTKQQTDDWRADNKKLTDAGLDAQSQALAAIKAQFVAAEAVRLQQAALAAARLKMDDLLKAQQEADREYWKDIEEAFWGGVVSDVDAIPGQLKDAAKAGLKSIGDTVGAAGREITDPNNWKALGQAVAQTGKDLVGSPLQSAAKVGGFYVEVGATATKVVTHIATHPVDTIKAIAGVDNWSKAMDPNVPVTERIGRVLVGIADAAANLASAGAIGSAAKVADAAVDAVKLADKVSDAVRGADKVIGAGKAADKAADLTKVAAVEGKAEAAAVRQQAWTEAQAAGKTKVSEFDKARLEVREAAKSGDAAAKAAAEDRLRKATLEVQGDKQALWDINKRPDAVKNDFNKEMGGIYQSTDRMVVDELCRKNGINPADLRETMPGSGIYHNKNTGLPEVVVVKPTNVSDKIKVGADRDVTIRIRQYGKKFVADPENPGKFIQAGGTGVLTDVSSKELTPIYNKAFHHASGADTHFPSTSPKDFADKMDQVATDRLHAEAYGRGQKDLQVAISKPEGVFSDAEQVARAAQYKSDHLYKQSHELAAQGKFAEAETAMAEGMRQSTKQFENQVLKRAEALQAQGVDATIPQRLRDDMEIMKKAQTDGWSPARIAEELKVRHTTVEDVTQRSASMLESLQKLRPR